nr:MAG: nonstructural polyprotein [Dicistroviridae sp.]
MDSYNSQTNSRVMSGDSFYSQKLEEISFDGSLYSKVIEQYPMDKKFDFDSRHFKRLATPQMEPETQEPLGDNQELPPIIEEDENLSLFQRLKAFCSRQFEYISGTTRQIGISVKCKLESFVRIVISVIGPAFSRSFQNILKLISQLLFSLINRIWTSVGNSIERARGMICSTAALIIGGLALCLPSSFISFFGRILLGAMSLLVVFTQSYFMVGAGVGLTYLLSKMTSKYSFYVNTSVNNNLAQPQFSSLKEDTKTLVLDLVSLGVLVSAGITGLSIPTDAKSWDDLLKRHSLLHRAFNSWDFAAGKISEIFDRVAHFIFKHILGKEYSSVNHIAQIENLYADVLTLCRLDVNIQIGRDPKLAVKIEQMYLQYLQLCRVYATNREIMAKLTKLGAPLTDYYRRVTDKNPKAHVMRKEPVCICLSGATGIGKSYMMNRLQQDLLKISGKFDPEQLMEGLIYARAVEQEFWDGYVGQPIAIYDDFGQKVDSQANPNLEFFEIIRAVNIFPYPLHTAALQDKANTPFTSDFVILTTNLANFRVESIRSQEAFQRRIHLNMRVKIKEEVGSLIAGQLRLDLTKLEVYRRQNNLESHDMSHLIFVDEDGTELSYDQFVVSVSKVYQSHVLAYDQRMADHQTTSTHSLPIGAYSADQRWCQSTDQVRIPIPSEATPQMIEPQFLEPQPPLENVSQWWDEVDIDHPVFDLDYWLRIQNPPVESRFSPMRIFNRSVTAFNKFVRKVFIEPIQDSSLLPFALECWESLSFIREKAREVGLVYQKYFIESTLAIGACAIFFSAFLLRNKDFSPEVLEKTPYLHTIINSLSDLEQTDLDSYYKNESFKIKVGEQCTILNKTDIRKILYHSLQHSTFDMECDQCKRDKSIYDKVPQSAHQPTVPDLIQQLDSIETKLLESRFKADVESPTRVQHVKKEPAIESSMKTEVKKSEPVIESPMRADAKKKEPEIEASQVVNNTKTDAETESPTRVNFVNKTIKLESQKSSDSIPKTNSSVSRVESSQHVPITKMFADPESGRASDDNKKRKKAAIESVAEVEGLLSAQVEPIKAVIRRNTWVVQAQFDGRKEHIGFVIAIKGHKAFINFHYIEYISILYKKCVDKSSFKIFFHQPNMEGGHLTSLEQFTSEMIPIFRGQHQTEFYLFTLPKACPFGRDLTKHLLETKKATSLLRGVPLQLVTYRKGAENHWEPMSVAGPLEKIHKVEIPDLTDPSKTHTYLESVYYCAPSTKGDCGNCVIIDSNEFTRKILGFHFAGLDGKGIASVITYNDIAKFVENEPCLADPQHFSLEEVSNFPLQGSFRVQGKALFKISHPCKTSIEPSAIHGLFGPPEMIPAQLAAPLKPDGPMLKALQKVASDVDSMIDKHKLESVRRDYFETCIAPFTPLEIEQTVLDFKTACTGIEGNDYFPPIKRGKSAGYPYMAQATRGKYDWLGDEEWDFSSEKCKELKKDVHDMIQAAKFNIIPEAVFVATLKDEKRLVEKVVAGKTRVFSACPLHYLIAFRQYFAGFIAFMGRNKIHNESAIGTNCHGYDWKEIVRHLTPWSEQNISAGDFKEFDGTFQPEVFDMVCDSINDFYQGTPEDARIRKSLWRALVNPLHILDVFVFAFSHGQPSGSPITAISNSAYVSHCVRYVLFDVLRELKMSFRNHVRLIAYGDDTLISFSPHLAKHLSSHKISVLFKDLLGMKYTSASKDYFTPEDTFQSIKEVTFLKRGFLEDVERKHWYAPLDLTSIREQCNWIHKGPSVVQATIDNCIGAMKELCHHPRNVFEEYCFKITTALKEHGLLVHIPDWDHVRDEMSLGQIDYMSIGRPFV